MPSMHPTPLFRRDSWFSLDGEWQLNGQPIRVPYPPEAPLSGWIGSVPRDMRYEKAFTLPEGTKVEIVDSVLIKGSQSEWYKIETPDGKVGWMYKHNKDKEII